MVVRSVAVALVACFALVACGRSSKAKPADDAPDDKGPIDPAEQAARYDAKCVAGNLDACRLLGTMYAEGTGVSPDPKRAVTLFEHACDGGNMDACNTLAFALAQGTGVDKSAARAVELFQKACDGGYKVACRNLGLMLRDGRGTLPDLPRAEQLLDKACKGAVPFACTNAGDLDEMLAAKGGPARWKQARDHYAKGCDTGDAVACRHLGIAYLDGKGVAKSTTAAAMWLERGCLPDDPLACRLLGVMVLQGIGRPRDVERGKQLLARACDAKDEEACRLLRAASEPSATDAGVLGSLSDAALAAPRDAHGLSN